MRGQRTWGMWTPGPGGQSAAPGTSRGPRLVTPGTGGDAWRPQLCRDGAGGGPAGVRWQRGGGGG